MAIIAVTKAGVFILGNYNHLIPTVLHVCLYKLLSMNVVINGRHTNEAVVNATVPLFVSCWFALDYL